MNLLNRFTLTKFIPFKLLFTRKNRINFIRSNLVRFQHNSIENRAKNDFKSSVCVQNLGEICVIRLNRGHCRNALDRLAIEQLIEAFKLFNNHPQFKVGVLCGSEGNLSIGLDWRDFTQEEQLDKINDLVKKLVFYYRYY